MAGFERVYGSKDAVLLAHTAQLHGTLLGTATRKICERMYLVYDDLRYENLAKISVSHLYHLQQSKGDQRRQFDKTQPVRAHIR